MANKLKFHLDESVSNAIAKGLRIRGIDVKMSSEEGLFGASDQEQLAYALSQGRVVFTFDDDFLVLSSMGLEHCGIIYSRQGQSIGKIISNLVLIWECLDPDYMYRNVEFL
jgi:predicted nuclease of predicted toxin-antitoxin system